MLQLNRRCTALLSAGVITAALGGCSKASDPKAITIDELKYPGGLLVRDDGNGDAILFWTGTNNEEDFDGYNIYGMKADATIAALEGTALQLLNEEGDPVEAARTTLAMFNYSPADGYKFEQKGTKEGAEKDFSALPVHTLDGEDPLLPTCKNSGTKDTTTGAYACGATTKDTVGKDVDDNSAYATNGLMSYAVTGLTAGQKYCFLVMSSIKEGKKVSQTSSNVACVTPKKGFTLQAKMPGATTEWLHFDLAKLASTCASTPASCTAPSVSTTATDILFSTSNTSTTDAFKKSAYISYTSSGEALAIEAGTYNGIQNLGYYKDGFKDKTLPMSVPKMSIGTIVNLSGYSIPGQSILLLKNHMYVVAVADAAATAAPAAHTYIWFWVKGTPTMGSTPDIEFRVPLGTDQL